MNGAAGTGTEPAAVLTTDQKVELLRSLPQEEKAQLLRDLREAEAAEDQRRIIEDRRARREQEWEDRLKGINRREQPWLGWRGALLKAERMLLASIARLDAAPPGETPVDQRRREGKLDAERSELSEIHEGTSAPQFGGLRGTLAALGIKSEPDWPNVSLRRTERMLATFAEERAEVERQKAQHK